MTEEVKKQVIITLKTLKEDAQMALSGDWDCSTQEGIETGFEAQILLIDRTLDLLK